MRPIRLLYYIEKKYTNIIKHNTHNMKTKLIEQI